MLLWIGKTLQTLSRKNSRIEAKFLHTCGFFWSKEVQFSIGFLVGTYTVSSKKCALAYHQKPTPGKIAIRPSKPIRDPQDLSLAYSPGVAQACEAIFENPASASQYTARGKTVAVISNGTAVLGLGDIGALASKPVMEGKAALLYRFGGVQSIDIEIQEKDPQKLIEIIASLEPSFGAINLEDIKAPDCFVVERALSEKMSIPIFHDDQHGTAVVVAAALINALYLKGQSMESAKCVVVGAGAAAIACLDFLRSFGLHKDNIFLCDSKGIVHSDRNDLTSEKRAYARQTSLRTPQEALDGADILIGLSRPNALSKNDIKNMAPKPIIFPLSNPTPEIMPEDILSVHPDALVGTGRSDMPNQINNLLCFPYIFRGCLDAEASKISENMKKACVHALVHLTRKGFSDSHGIYEKSSQEFGPDYLIPQTFDPRLRIEIPIAVAKEALKESGKTEISMDIYRKELSQEAYRDRLILGALVALLPSKKKVIWYHIEGDHIPQGLLQAAQYMVRYDLASVGLITSSHSVQSAFKETPLLAQAPILSQPPHESDSLCIRAGSEMPSSDEMVGFYSGENLVIQAPSVPGQSTQKVLLHLGCNIEWKNANESPVLYGNCCMFLRTTQEADQTKVLGPLRIQDSPCIQWVDHRDSAASIIEKSCFVILQNLLA